MRCQAMGVKSGDELEKRTLGVFLVDYFLREFEAATTLNFASLAGVGSLRRAAAGSNGLTDLALSNAIADAHDHGIALHDNATHSQLDSAAQIFPGNEGRRQADEHDMRKQLRDDGHGRRR